MSSLSNIDSGTGLTCVEEFERQTIPIYFEGQDLFFFFFLLETSKDMIFAQLSILKGNAISKA